jgi:hypothetical protein
LDLDCALTRANDGRSNSKQPKATSNLSNSTMTLPQLTVVATLILSLLATTSLAFTSPALIHQRKQQSGVLWSSQSPPPPQKINPPLSKKEIEEWLDYVPVYTVTDPEGKLVFVKPEGVDRTDDNIFTFYLSRSMAEETLAQLKLKSNPETSDIESVDLKLSAFALGQIWFDLIMAESDSESVSGSIVHAEIVNKCLHHTHCIVAHTLFLHFCTG